MVRRTGRIPRLALRLSVEDHAFPKVRLTIMSNVADAIEAGETDPPRYRVPAVVRTGLLVVGWLIVAGLAAAAVVIVAAQVAFVTPELTAS